MAESLHKFPPSSILLRAVPFIFAAMILPALLLFRTVTLNYQLEKSVLRPGAFPVLRTAPLSSDAPLDALRHRLRARGVRLHPHGDGFRALIHARRAPSTRCFALAVHADDTHALAAADAILVELLGSGPRGLALLFLVHHDKPESLLPHPGCVFLRDGVALQTERGAPALFYLPFAAPGIAYDYELHQGLMETLRSPGFLRVPLRLLAPQALAPFHSAAAALRPPPAPHTALLARGVDAATLRLRFTDDFALVADLARAGLAAFRLAEGCDRALESQHFLYLPSGTRAALLKTRTLPLAFTIAGVGLLPALATATRPPIVAPALARIAPAIVLTVVVHALPRFFRPSCAFLPLTAVAILSFFIAAIGQLILSRIIGSGTTPVRTWTRVFARLILSVAALRVTLIHPLLAVMHLGLLALTSPLDCEWKRLPTVAVSGGAFAVLVTFREHLFPLFPLSGLPELFCENNPVPHYFFSTIILGHLQYFLLFFFA